MVCNIIDCSSIINIISANSHPIIDGSAFMKKRLGILDRDMNAVGLALILLLLLQYIVILTTYYIIARCSGYNITLNGLSLKDITTAITQLRNAVSNQPAAYPAALLLYVLIGNIVPAILCAKLTGIKVSGLITHSQIKPLEITIYGIIAIGASILASLVVKIISLILNFFNLQNMPVSLKIPYNSVPGIIMITLAVVVAAPITEELICRGVILRIFRRYGDVFAIVGSALIWALLHGNLTQGLPVFVMGLIFGIIAIKAGSIAPTIIIHSINNAIALIQMIAVQTKNLMLMAFSGFFNIAIFAAAVVLAAIYMQRLLQINGKRSGSGRGFAMFFTCIPILIAIGIYIAFTALTIRPL
nr:MAG: CPBP family intramembrane metalloprotease [[Clostridium] cellulosi]